MKIELIGADQVKIEMSRVDFEKLQDILRCQTHITQCQWHSHAVSIRQAITFFGSNETEQKKH